MRTPCTAYRFFGAMLLLLGGVQTGRGQQPDPVALLRGVQQARAKLAGRLHLSILIRMARDKVPGDPMEYDVEFDRDRRRFIIKQTILLVTPPNEEEKRRRIEALNDNKAAAAAGLGKMTPVEVRAVFDGTQLVDYSDQYGAAYIRVPERGLHVHCFDVRILGLCAEHFVYETLDRSLGLAGKGTAALVGREEVGGRSVWHVKVVYPGFEKHYWIEDSDGFRVHRSELKSPSDGSEGHTVVLSEYGNGPDRPLLPVRVSQEEKYKGKFRGAVTTTVTNVDYRFKPDPAVFEFAGLDLAPGTEVSDDRVHRLAGYWDGTGLSESREEALAKGAKHVAAQVKPPGFSWVTPTLVAAAAVLLVAAVIGYRRFARHKAA